MGKAPVATTPPEIFRAVLRSQGIVERRGAPMDQATAIGIRESGGDVVVCGPNVVDNFRVAQDIEKAATVNRFMLQSAHVKSAGPKALSHFQPIRRPPQGHTFFEAPPYRTAR